MFGARSVHAPTDRVDPVNASRSRKLCRLSPRPPSIQTSLTHHLHSHQNSIHPYCTVHDPHTTYVHRIQRPAHHGPHRTAHRMRLLGSRMAQLSTLSLKGLPRSSLSPPHSKSDYPQTIVKNIHWGNQNLRALRHAIAGQEKQKHMLETTWIWRWCTGRKAATSTYK